MKGTEGEKVDLIWKGKEGSRNQPENNEGEDKGTEERRGNREEGGREQKRRETNGSDLV